MTLPAYWWLLALSIIFQGVFFVRIAILRIRGKRVQPLARLTAAALFASGAAGLVYGTVQRDPVFFAGQMCLFVIYLKMLKGDDSAG